MSRLSREDYEQEVRILQWLHPEKKKIRRRFIELADWKENNRFVSLEYDLPERQPIETEIDPALLRTTEPRIEMFLEIVLGNETRQQAADRLQIGIHTVYFYMTQARRMLRGDDPLPASRIQKIEVCLICRRPAKIYPFFSNQPKMCLECFDQRF